MSEAIRPCGHAGPPSGTASMLPSALANLLGSRRRGIAGAPPTYGASVVKSIFTLSLHCRSLPEGRLWKQAQATPTVNRGRLLDITGSRSAPAGRLSPFSAPLLCGHLVN
jgi:hypothetical protein